MNDSRKILSGMSHEIRTYMNSIVSYSFLKEEEVGNMADSGYGNLIFTTCNQALSLMENYLQSQMIDKEPRMVRLNTCRASRVINDLLPDFNDILRQHSNKKIRLVIENDIPDAVDMYADTEKLSKSILNFFRNSVNNMEGGQINVGCRLTKNDIIFHVLDTEQDHMKARAFLITNDLDQTLTRYFDAITAVNIRLSKKLIGLLGGNISIVCNELYGTGVYISLPVRPAESYSFDDKKSLRYHEIWKRLVNLLI